MLVIDSVWLNVFVWSSLTLAAAHTWWLNVQDLAVHYAETIHSHYHSFFFWAGGLQSIPDPETLLQQTANSSHKETLKHETTDKPVTTAAEIKFTPQQTSKDTSERSSMGDVSQKQKDSIDNEHIVKADDPLVKKTSEQVPGAKSSVPDKHSRKSRRSGRKSKNQKTSPRHIPITVSASELDEQLERCHLSSRKLIHAPSSCMSHEDSVPKTRAYIAVLSRVLHDR